MGKSSWSPSIIPKEDDQNVYLVLDDFGRNGRATPKPTLSGRISKPSSWV